MTIPCIIVSGYLGAGKTTLINAFLRNPDGVRATVLVNDFGAINLDADLIENTNGDTIALTNGCACCAIGDDLLAAANKAVEGLPDLIVVEASGVAEPARLAMLLRGVAGLNPARIVAVINAAAFDRNRTDKFISRLYKSQIASAHFLHVNRVGASRSKLDDFLAATAPKAGLIGALKDVPFDPLQMPTQVDAETRPHMPGFKSLVLRLSTPIGLETLENALGHPSQPIERAKGFVETPDGRYRIDFVQGAFTARKANPSMNQVPNGIVALAVEEMPLLELKQKLVNEISLTSHRVPSNLHRSTDQ